jgi:tetratricopeptide (TPR) repeat protein
MTMNYCGRCGAANGTAARYCRQCGAELNNQAAFSSASARLNVEFSARNTPKDHQRETLSGSTPATSFNNTDTGKLSGSAVNTLDQTPSSGTAPESNEKAISESLKRIRASGPLIVEAVKKRQERISQIISESIEPRNESKSESKSVAPVPKPETKTSNSSPLTQAATAVKTQFSSSQSSAPANRKTTGSLMPTNYTSGRASGSGQLPPNGPSTVLAQASGLGKNSNFGSKLRLSLIAAIVVLSASGYFLLRDKLTTPTRLLDAGRNLLSAEEQSSYLLKRAQHDREQGQYETAIGYFRNALALTPDNSEVHFMLAQTYASADRSEEALREYQTVLRLAPDHLESRLQIAEIYRARGQWPTAISEYKRIIAFDQNSPQAAIALEAMETYESGKGDTDAKSQRKNVIAQNVPVALPGGNVQSDISLPLPRMTSVAGIKPPVATQPEERPDPRVAADSHKKLGLRYYNVREYPAAIKEFLAAYRLTPEDKDLLYFIGSCYYGLGQQAQAHDYFKRVDSGNYVGVAQSNAARTEKAAREEAKRRELMKGDTINQVKNDLEQKNKGPLNSFE